MAEKEQDRLSFPDSVRAILAARTPDEETREALSGLGLEPTVLNAIHWGMSGKAARGDPSAAKYLRDTLEERDTEPDPAELGAAELSSLTDAQLRALAERAEGP